MKTAFILLLINQLSALIGSLILMLGIVFWPNSTARFSIDLFLSISVVSIPIVNVISLLLVFPLWLNKKIPFETCSDIYLGAMVGGGIYLTINTFIALISGEQAFIQFFSTKAFLFPFLAGALFSAILLSFIRIFNRFVY